MKQVGNIKLYTLDEILDEDMGKIGTPERDAFEAEVHAYKIGEAIKKARISQHLTQEQLGERLGVQRAQISRIEKGRSISISTMRRVFKALGIASATLDLGTIGKIALW